MYIHFPVFGNVTVLNFISCIFTDEITYVSHLQFQIVVFCTMTVIVSFFITNEKCIDYAHPSLENIQSPNKTHNVTTPCGYFTGFSSSTFKSNTGGNYQSLLLWQHTLLWTDIFNRTCNHASVHSDSCRSLINISCLVTIFYDFLTTVCQVTRKMSHTCSYHFWWTNQLIS